MGESFGELLRECRTAAGLSMGQLARSTHYSKGYLSRIENDLKPPTPDLARLCDGVLNAGGVLVDAARAEVRENGPKLDRRQVLVGGAMLGIAFAGGPRPAPDDQVITGIRAGFEHLRGLGTHTSPVVVLEPLIAQVRTVEALAQENTGPIRTRLLLLAARIAEYTGWMCQESGSDEKALWWTRHAAELARAGGDQEIESYALVREAGLALYREDADTTVSLARRAQRAGRPGVRTLMLAARREAQGHALTGDRYATEHAFARAAELLDVSDADERPYPALGPTAPDSVDLARGWALCDLGLTADAAELLDRCVVRLPPSARRTRARFGVRRSLAHVLSGDVDRGCAMMAEALPDVAHVDSALVRIDVRRLARTLGRWHNHGAVRELQPGLKRVLRSWT